MIAVLDDRTCMSCISLHGTRLPINARVDDHHSGRCDSVTKVRGLPVPVVESGEDWFNRRTDSQQQAQMGVAAWHAWQAGAFNLDQYPRPYTDDLFGDMIGHNSLVGILGAKAQEFK